MDEIWQFLTVVIALVVAFISYRQYAVARDRFRLDLFEKRYGVFCGARDFVASVVREGRVVDTAQREFWRSTSDVQFLFGSDVVEYLDLVNRQAAQAHYHRVSISTVKAEEERSGHIEAETQIVLWFAEQSETGLTNVFLPYLGFARWSGRRFWRLNAHSRKMPWSRRVVVSKPVKIFKWVFSRFSWRSIDEGS